MIVGCDYSTKAVDLAFRTSRGEWWNTKLPYELSAQFLATLKEVLDVWWTNGGVHERVLYIEQPWFGPAQGGYSNPMTSMAMVKVSTAVQVVALQRGYRVEWAHPSSWRSKVLPKRRYTKAQAKAASLQWAEENTNLLFMKDHNAADACCIARYGELKEAG